MIVITHETRYSGRVPQLIETTRDRAARAGTGAGLLIARVARIAGYRMGRALEDTGLSAHEFAVLHRLADTGPAHQQEISRILRVHPSNLVAILDGLEGAGLIARRRDPMDRRRHSIHLTAAGMRRLGQAEGAVARAEQELLSPLSAPERAQLRALLARVADHACSEKRGCF